MTVVCGTDFSTNASEASQIAARIAHRRGENLLLVHVVQPAPTDPAGDHNDFLRSSAVTALENTAAELRALGMIVETDALIGSPAHEIVAHAPDDTTLFVTGARGHSRAAHWLIGSVAERLAHIVPHPLLVVRHGRDLNRWLDGVRDLDVLIATDFSLVSDYALHRASLLRELGKCNVDLTYVEDPPADYQFYGIEGPIHRRPSPLLEEVLSRELKKRAAKLDWCRNVETHTVFTFTRPVSRIVATAENQRADLIVVGMHQRHGLSRIWHESISQGVLHATSANVLCVPYAESVKAEEAISAPLRSQSAEELRRQTAEGPRHLAL